MLKRILINKGFQTFLSNWYNQLNLLFNDMDFNRLGADYPGKTRSNTWLLMSWRLASPGNQQPCCWLCRINGPPQQCGRISNASIILLSRNYTICKYRQTSNIRRILVGNKIVDHSDVFRASPVGATPTRSSFWTKPMVSMDWIKTLAKRDEKHSSSGIWCALY